MTTATLTERLALLAIELEGLDVEVREADSAVRAAKAALKAAESRLAIAQSNHDHAQQRVVLTVRRSAELTPERRKEIVAAFEARLTAEKARG